MVYLIILTCKVPRDIIFVLTMIRELKGEREKIVTRPCCKLFSVTNGEREKMILLAACVGLSFPDICGQRTMTNKGAKRNVPHLLQAQQAPVCGQYRKCSSTKRSTASSPSQLLPGGYAGVRRFCGAVFQQISGRFKYGERGKRGRKIRH